MIAMKVKLNSVMLFISQRQRKLLRPNKNNKCLERNLRVFDIEIFCAKKKNIQTESEIRVEEHLDKLF